MDQLFVRMFFTVLLISGTFFALALFIGVTQIKLEDGGMWGLGLMLVGAGVCSAFLVLNH